MALLLFSTIVSVVGALGLAAYAWRYNNGKQANVYFSLTSVLLAMWVVVFYWSMLHYDLILVRLTMAIIVFFLCALFLFIYSFVFTQIPANVKYPFVLFALVNAIVALSPYQFTHTELVGGLPMPMPGWGMVLFACYHLGITATVIVLLVRHIKRSLAITRIQTQFILTGFCITFGVLIFTNLFAVSILHTRAFFPLGVVSLLAFIGCTAYAMTRYRFLDVRVILKKSVVYGTILALFCAAYIAVVVFLYESVLYHVPLHPFLWLMLSALVFVLTFEHLKLKTKRFLDGLFFREEMNFYKHIDESKKVLNSTHEIDSFVLKLAGSIQEVIKAPVQEVFVRQDLATRYTSFFPVKSKHYISFEEPVVQEVMGLRRMYLFLDELEHEGVAPLMQKMMRKKKAKLCMVVFTRSYLLMLVFIGEHKNHMQFSRQDIKGLKEFYVVVQEQLPLLFAWQETIENAKVLLQNQE